MHRLLGAARLADKLVAALPSLDPAEQGIAVALMRELAHGAPVPAARLARTLALSEAEVAAALDRWSAVLRDDRRRVIGFMGLSVVEMGRHRIHVDGRTLSAWCAWDTLFLPELLDKTVGVSSGCPITDQPISLTVTPNGPADLRPAGAVVSFLAPGTSFDADVLESFCHFVHFFASRQAGARWTAEHAETFLISVEDAYRLGRLTNRATFGAVVAPKA